MSTSTFQLPVDERGRYTYLNSPNQYGQHLDTPPFVTWTWVTAVVACKTHEGIVRGIHMTSWWNPQRAFEVAEEVVNVVGRLHLEDQEWTGGIYRWPGYLPRPEDNSGIFLFPTIDWAAQTFSPRGTLLHRPRGW